MTDREIVILHREDDLWDWHVVAPNGEVVFGSVQGFPEKNKAKAAAERELPGVPIRVED